MRRSTVGCEGFWVFVAELLRLDDCARSEAAQSSPEIKHIDTPIPRQDRTFIGSRPSVLNKLYHISLLVTGGQQYKFRDFGYRKIDVPMIG